MCGDKFSFLDEVEGGAAREDADAGRPHTGESRDRVRQPPGSERDASKYSGIATLRPSSPPFRSGVPMAVRRSMALEALVQSLLAN